MGEMFGKYSFGDDGGSGSLRIFGCGGETSDIGRDAGMMGSGRGGSGLGGSGFTGLR